MVNFEYFLHLEQVHNTLLSYGLYGPVRYFLGKPYETRSHMKAVCLDLMGQEKPFGPTRKALSLQLPCDAVIYKKLKWKFVFHLITACKPINNLQ